MRLGAEEGRVESTVELWLWLGAGGGQGDT